MYTIFIGGLTFNTDTEMLTNFLHENEVNPVDGGVRIILTREGESRGFAYADFDSKEESEKCVELSGKELDGRTIRCEDDGGRGSGGRGGNRGGRGAGFGGRGRGRGRGGGGNFGASQNDDIGPTKLLMLKNLSWGTDNAKLGTLFPESHDARVCTFRDTGKSRGFAFVEFDDVEKAIAARDQYNQQDIDGREVDIVFAIPREEFGGRQQRDFS